MKTDYYEIQKLITEELAVTLEKVEKSDIEKLLAGIQKAEKVFFVGVLN